MHFMTTLIQFIRKWLITTTFVFCFISGATANIKTTGSIDSQIVNIKEETGHKNTHNNNIVTDAYLKFGMNGNADSGLKYGGMIKVNAGVPKSKKKRFYDNTKGNIAEQTMVYLEGKYGRVEIGNYTGIANAMKVNAATFASATGGINGDFQYYWDRDTVTTVDNPKRTMFLKTPNLPTNELCTVGINGVNAAKVNYYTSEFSGFRFATSYTPDSKAYGTASSVSNVLKDENGFKNIFEFGLLYLGEIQNVGVKFGMVGEFGKNKNPANKNLKAWDAGVNLSYRGFTVGASYGNWGRYNVPKTSNDQYTKTDYWNAGIGYAFGPFSASITHLQSKRGIESNRLRNTVLGVDYKIAAGLLSYFEFSSFKMNDKQNTELKNNQSSKGHILIAGMSLKF